MKKLLLAASVAMTVCGVQSVLAADEIVITKAGSTDSITVPLTNFTYNSLTNVLKVTTTQTLSVGDGGNDGGNNGGGGEEPGGEEPGGEEPGGEEPGDGDTDSCDVAGVSCRYAIASWPTDKAGLSMTIPRGEIVSSKFVAGPAGQAGSVDFEAKAQFPYPAMNFWISTAPGGDAIGKGSRINYCSKERVSFIFGISWIQGTGAGGCALTPGKTYYLNIEHVSKSTSPSTVYRYIK